MNSHPPEISIIMIDGSFRESFHSIDSFCQQNFPKENFELLWVEFLNQISPVLSQKISQYPNARIVMLNRQEDLYHSSFCFNQGIREAKGKILVIPDADIVVEDHFLSAIYKEHARNHELAMYFHRQCQKKEFFKKGSQSIKYLKQTSVIPKPDNYGGCLTVRKKWMEKINGYEQHRAFATGNHANGKDVYTRLKNLGLYIKWHPRIYLYHPWHPGTSGEGADKKRVKWQQEIVKYRGTHLITSALNGFTTDTPASQTLPPPPLGDPDGE